MNPPVVDLAVLVEAVEKGGAEDTVSIVQKQPEVKNVARLLHQALSQHGLCYLSNHGLSQSVLDRAFSASKQFFQLAEDVKQKYARSHGDPYGFSGVGMEMLINKRTHGDLKECFNFSSDDEKMIPTEVPDMDQSFKDMAHGSHVLVCRILDLLGVAMGLEDPGFMSRTHQSFGKQRNYGTVRCVRYPTDVRLKENQLSCGEHTDYGSITLLFLDDRSGLQAIGKDGEYHDVLPIPGTVVVQTGDIMQRWTANQCPALLHRVVLPADAAAWGQDRVTLAYFAVPDNDTLIECLDGSDTYPPIIAADYFKSRLSITSY